MITFTDWVKTVAVPYLKKLEGQKILKGPGLKKPSLPKDLLLRLLNKLCLAIENNLQKNIKSGFCKAGIVPFDRTQVLSMLPEDQLPNSQDVTETLENSTRKKCNIAAGKSVTVSDASGRDGSEDAIELDDESADSTVDEKLEGEGQVTKFGKTFDNVFPVPESEVAIGDCGITLQEALDIAYASDSDTEVAHVFIEPPESHVPTDEYEGGLADNLSSRQLTAGAEIRFTNSRRVGGIADDLNSDLHN
ncbi:hypothetical protein JTB14_009336 [Gonioctena quinquepunctata]|nr:hypothetical protein JTB14_009336 [Gonioctena quinquepunctata]